jgi:homoserine dehydrogenase
MTTTNIAVVGLGTVGLSLLRYLNSTSDARLKAIRVRAVADSSGVALIESQDSIAELIRHKESGGSASSFHKSLPIQRDRELAVAAVRAAGVDVLVESLPTNVETGEPGLGLLEAALRGGLNVVTVDKGPLVHGFDKLLDAAAQGSVRIAFSGTTGVAIPDDLGSERVVEIRGVLNGTSNFILGAIQESGMPFDEALSFARSEGVAEPDPRLDIDGWDTACKILILAKALMGARTTLSEVHRIGIGPGIEHLIATAKETARVVRLVGRARLLRGSVRISVAPKLVTPRSPFYALAGTSKGAVFKTAEGREVFVAGKSGRDAIAQTICNDLLRVEGNPASSHSTSNLES